jgi:hypothetical protein
MIMREQITFCAHGENFMPSKVAVPFSASHDPGAIGKVGRYKDLPTPYGSADFEAPEEETQKIAYLHRLVLPHLMAMRKAGAEDFLLHITYHGDSGAIGFSKEEMKLIAELECDVPIDCVIDEEPNTPDAGGKCIAFH